MYEWLKGYQELEDKISFYEDNLLRSKRELKRWVEGDLAKVKLTAESDGAKLEDCIRIIEHELAHKMNDLYSLRTLVKSFKSLEQKILYGKYVEGKTLEKIAEELNYGTGWITKKHAAIKKKMRKIS